MKYETRITEWTVVPENEPTYSERATVVKIADQCGGEYLRIEQDDNKIEIDPAEWPTLRAVIDHAVEQCRSAEM